MIDTMIYHITSSEQKNKKTRRQEKTRKLEKDIFPRARDNLCA